ncbi:MAG TPA: rhomboid family intramembrane serine protease [Pirellulaceae bacterium]|nr:rhomboid family intramembrane serine protease [Pirellulaceae bacterium]
MVFPVADDNSDRTIFPWLNIGLIAVNVLVFVVFQGMGGNDRFTYAFSTVPAEITTGRDLVTEPHVEQVETPVGVQRIKVPGLEPTPLSVYLTLLTSMFMHGGIAHLLGNMWFLWIFGDNIEQDMGRVRYLVFYLVCGLLASLTHVVLNAGSQIPSLGASGAISGVLGAYLLLHSQRRVTVVMFRFLTQVPGWVAVGLWFAFQVIQGLGVLGGEGTGVAYGAHIGGFIAGLALAKVFMIGRPTTTEQKASYGQQRYRKNELERW